MPSIEEQKQMAKTDADRLSEQRQALGEQGLAKKADELEKAMAQNEVPPPNEVLTQVPIPDTSNVNSLSSTVQERGGEVFGDVSKLNGLNLDDFPLPIKVTACGTDSNFGYVSANYRRLPPGENNRTQKHMTFIYVYFIRCRASFTSTPKRYQRS